MHRLRRTGKRAVAGRYRLRASENDAPLEQAAMRRFAGGCCGADHCPGVIQLQDYSVAVTDAHRPETRLFLSNRRRAGLVVALWNCANRSGLHQEGRRGRQTQFRSRAVVVDAFGQR